MSNSNQIFAKNFLINKEKQVLDVQKGPGGILYEVSPDGGRAASTGTSVGTGTKTKSSTTSGTNTKTSFDISTFGGGPGGFPDMPGFDGFPDALGPFGAGDTDDDNSQDDDSDWDAVLDSDESSSQGANPKIVGVSRALTVKLPFEDELQTVTFKI